MSATADPTWWLIGAVLMGGFVIGLLAFAASTVIVSARTNRREQMEWALEVEAADWDERSRAQIEADMRADDEWVNILAAVDLTPQQVRRAWNEAREMDAPIHDKLAVERLRADLEAWGRPT